LTFLFTFGIVLHPVGVGGTLPVPFVPKLKLCDRPFGASKMLDNLSTAGARPQTAPGELTVLPQTHLTGESGTDYPSPRNLPRCQPLNVDHQFIFFRNSNTAPPKYMGHGVAHCEKRVCT